MAHIENCIEFRNPRSKEFAERWLSFRTVGHLPRWSDFSPSEVGRLLPHVTVLEWDGPDRLLYKFAGQGMVDRIGIDLTGTDFFEWVTPEAKGFVQSQGSKIFDHPSGVLTIMEETYNSGTSRLTENVVLPVTPLAAGRNLIVTHSVQIDGPDYAVEQDEGRTWMRFSALEPIDLGAGLPDVDFSLVRRPA